jgi:hypothetical protein
MVSLGLFTGDQRNYGFGINNHNQVTGQVYYGEVVQAFLWAPPGTFDESWTSPRRPAQRGQRAE